MSSPPRPPRLLRWVISWVCLEPDRSFVLSDLEEGFQERTESGGARAARRWYAEQVLRSLPPLVRRRVSMRRSPSAGPPVSSIRRRSPTEWIPDFLSDVRFALRSLRRDRLVVGVTLSSIGIGVGIVTAVFAVANSMLLRDPGAVAEPETLVAVHTSVPGGNRYAETSFLDYQDIADGVAALSPTAAWRAGGLRLSDDLGERKLFVEVVTQSYFDVLGAAMAAGRAFLPEETTIGAVEPVVVISHALWAERYARSSGVLGRVVHLDGRDFTIVGVAAEDLRGRFLEANVDAWVPIGLEGGISRSTAREVKSRGDRDYSIIARLSPGSTLDQAQAQLDNLATRLREAHPQVWLDDRGERQFTLLMGAEARLPPEGRAAVGVLALFLMAGGGFVLLIACTNVAGLFLARGDRRRKEIAVRLSMGANRGRILRLLLTESLILAVGSSVAGLAVTVWASKLLGRIPVPLDIPIGFTVRVDPFVASVALFVACLASLGFGLLPALQSSRPDLVDSLKGRGWSAAAGRRRLGLRQALVATQVAGSLTLLVGAGLVFRSLDRVAHMDFGLDPTGVAAASVSFDRSPTPTPASARLDELLTSLRADPRVSGAAASALADGSILFSSSRQARLDVAGWNDADGEPTGVQFNSVTPGYFEMLDMELLRGRPIDRGDVMGAPGAAVVNEAFVRRYWAEGDPIGRSFRIARRLMFDSEEEAPSQDLTVVGVVRGVSFDPTQAPEPEFWTPLEQEPSVGELVVHVKSQAGADEAALLLRAALHERGLEPSLFSVQPYRRIVDMAFMGSEAASLILSWAGGFTLLLATLGVFGVVSYNVARRRSEMAVRRALGASATRVVGDVVRDAMAVVGIGVGAGLLLVVALAPLAEAGLYGLPPLDPVAMLGGTGVLTVAALLASWLPARSMASVEPVEALHEE